MAALYPGIAPVYQAYSPGLGLGSGLQGCSAYPVRGFWHYVSYGLTELWVKRADSNPDWSGWGYEFTMRVARPDVYAPPPQWPYTLLERLARVVHGKGLILGAGHRMDVGEPITGGTPPTTLTALAFAADPLLPTRRTEHGNVEFLQIVGITRADLAEMHDTSTAYVLAARAAAGDPLWITDPRI
nr:suppressor of fused domain protein [Streptomyces sp. SID3343]